MPSKSDLKIIIEPVEKPLWINEIVSKRQRRTGLSIRSLHFGLPLEKIRRILLIQSDYSLDSCFVCPFLRSVPVTPAIHEIAHTI